MFFLQKTFTSCNSQNYKEKSHIKQDTSSEFQSWNMQKMENSRNIEKQRMVLTDFIKCRHDKNNLLYLKSGDHVLKVIQLHKVLIE